MRPSLVLQSPLYETETPALFTTDEGMETPYGAEGVAPAEIALLLDIKRAEGKTKVG